MSRKFVVPKSIITGKNAVSDAATEFAGMGKKALIVTGKTVVTLDCFKVLTDTLAKYGIDYTVFDGITGEPTDIMINEGLEAYKQNGCDFLIGIGGGSPLDSVKAIAVLYTCGGSIGDYMGKEIVGCFPPIAAIPTTAGTGSEATQFTVITDTKTDIKMLLKGEGLVPDLAIIDPLFTLTSPKSITASTGLDALTHAVESYTSKKAQLLTDALALSAVKRIFKYLPRAYKNGDDIEARSEMSIAALEAGICINNASVTIVHGMSRPIGALFHVPHGMSNAMLLPSCMAFAVDGAVERFADLGRIIGEADKNDSDETAAHKFIKALHEICVVCQVPTLEKYGIDEQKFFEVIDKMSEDAIKSGSPANTQKMVSKSDIVNLYTSLWSD